MRCLALAETWRKRQSPALFLANRLTPSIEEVILNRGHEIATIDGEPGTRGDLEATQDFLSRHNIDKIVLDGYGFKDDFVRSLQADGRSVAYIDDRLHLERYSADLLVNQNLHASSSEVPTSPDTRTLFGPRYVLMRPEFSRWADWKRSAQGQAEKVLVTLGGTDPDDATRDILEALAGQTPDHLRFIVVVGDANPNRVSVEASADCFSNECRVEVDPSQMNRLMREADLAISAAGSTAWELAYMQVPTLLVVLADNQAAIAAALEDEGFALDLGRVDGLDGSQLGAEIERLSAAPERREAMGKRGRAIVDGEGARRVAEALETL
jgi:UDP-2,4-diacetamido-2,4,6-trideoxy-beta-L-altropyranose hydrolase